MDIVYLGGKQAGVIGLLAVVGWGCKVKAVVPRDDMVASIAKKIGCNLFDSVKLNVVRNIIQESDLIVSVHSKEIVPYDILGLARLGGINVHPCLFSYKGANPINRFLADSGSRVSVGVHFMSEEVDNGEVIDEIFISIDRAKVNSVEGVYNILYPVYAEVIINALEICSGK